MKISAEAATRNRELINSMQQAWKELKEKELQMEDRTYFKFTARSHGLFPEVDLTARALLDIIAECNVERLKVSDAMQLYHLGSPATIHRKLNDLLAFGYIEHQHEGDNRRTKYLQPTRKALDIYNELGKAIKEAAQ